MYTHTHQPAIQEQFSHLPVGLYFCIQTPSRPTTRTHSWLVSMTRIGIGPPQFWCRHVFVPSTLTSPAGYTLTNVLHCTAGQRNTIPQIGAKNVPLSAGISQRHSREQLLRRTPWHKRGRNRYMFFFYNAKKLAFLVATLRNFRRKHLWFIIFFCSRLLPFRVFPFTSIYERQKIKIGRGKRMSTQPLFLNVN